MSAWGRSIWLGVGWALAVGAAAAVRLWNALAGPLMYGYDDWGHVAYALFLDLYGALPRADQGWSYFHPPLHYLIGAALAQLRSSEMLLRGLALWGGAASLGVAGLAAWVTRAASPERPALALAAFCAVAFLPVEIYASPMSGNEMTAAFFASATLVSLVAGERRVGHAGARATLARDARTGALAGLSLLSKFSGLLVFATAAAVVALRRGRAGAPSRPARLAVLGGVALILAGPWYARNALEYGTPLRLSRTDPLVAEIESAQPPGERGWLDFVAVSPRLWLDPDPQAPHLLHSVWGSLYTNAWVDTRSAWSHASVRSAARIRRAAVAMVALGVVPTALALLGGVLALRDLLRGRRVAVYLPLGVCAALTLASFVSFAAAVPTFASLKASYLLGASLCWGAFLARGIEGLADRSRNAAAAAAVLGVAACAGAALVGSAGLALPRLPESSLVGPVRLYFGEVDAARRLYARLLLGNRELAGTWSENVAAVELVAGDPARARAILERRGEREDDDAWNVNQLAVATALSGDLPAARDLFTRAFERGAGDVALANRGAVLAMLGDANAAADDLHRALGDDAGLTPAWRSLASLEADRGDAAQAEAAREAAERAAGAAPTGFPYGLGSGLGQRASPRIGRRWLLSFEGTRLRLAHAPAVDGW